MREIVFFFWDSSVLKNALGKSRTPRGVWCVWRRWLAVKKNCDYVINTILHFNDILHCNQCLQVQDCCVIFHPSTCALLGGLGLSQAVCIWQTPSLLDVTLGSGATLPILGEMRLRSTIRDSSGESDAADGSLYLPSPIPPIFPDPLAVYPGEISRCDTLEVDVSGAIGGGGRALRFEWAPISPSLGHIASALAATPPTDTR